LILDDRFTFELEWGLHRQVVTAVLLSTFIQTGGIDVKKSWMFERCGFNSFKNEVT
jgi:hypothetical protein